MKDTMYPLQTSIFNLLDGNLSWNGSNIPIYDEKTKIGNTDNIVVILSTQQEAPAGEQSDCGYFTESSIDLVVMQKSEFEVSKAAIHNVGEQILNILFPSYPETAIVCPGFQVIGRRTRAITRDFSITNTQSVVAKIITISCLMIEQN